MPAAAQLSHVLPLFILKICQHTPNGGPCDELSMQCEHPATRGNQLRHKKKHNQGFKSPFWKLPDRLPSELFIDKPNILQLNPTSFWREDPENAHSFPPFHLKKLPPNFSLCLCKHRLRGGWGTPTSRGAVICHYLIRIPLKQPLAEQGC